MPEKEPKKKTSRKSTPKKSEAAVEPAKKTTSRKTVRKEEEAPVEASPAKKGQAKPQKEKVSAATEATAAKAAQQPEESRIEAAKFFASQFSPAPAKAPAAETRKETATQVKERQETHIPGRYYDNKIVLMARDPHWCYAYWDISEKLMSEKNDAAKKHGTYRMILRVYDVTDVMFNGSNAHRYTDIDVSGDASNWYINVWEAGRTYLVELGFLAKDGSFIMIARSNAVGTPSDRVSDKVDEEWIEVGEDFDELIRMSGDGKRIGASENVGVVNLSGISSGSVSSFSSPAYRMEKEKGFFLWADAELIIYGGTEKNAKLTVKGEKVRLNEDGTFSLRFHFPDGMMDLPIEAVSSEGTDKRSIRISANRKTE